MREAGEHVICQSRCRRTGATRSIPTQAGWCLRPKAGTRWHSNNRHHLHSARDAPSPGRYPSQGSARARRGLSAVRPPGRTPPRRRCLPASQEAAAGGSRRSSDGSPLPAARRPRSPPLRDPARARPLLRAAQAQCAGRGRGAQAQSAPRSRAVAAAGSLRGGCDRCWPPGRRGVGSPVPARGRRHTKERGDRPSRHTPQK